MDRPLVSIVTPSYNEEDFIEETLQSVKGQSYDNIEHIVVDGESDDATLDILGEFENEYEMRWVSRPDEGLYDAISTGFDMASGKYLAWINANDLYLPWAVEVAVRAFESTSAEWITGRSANIDEEGRLQYVSRIQQHYKRSWVEKGWYHGKGLGWFCQPSMFWTSSLWDASGGFPDGKRLAGEHYLWRRFARHSALRSVNSLLGVHRVHEGQLSEAIDEWYDEVDTELLPYLLGKVHADELYSLYKIVFS